MSDSFKIKRHNARIIVLQKLFERTFQTSKFPQNNLPEFPAEELKEETDIRDFDNNFMNQLFVGVLKYQKIMDKAIAQLAPEWPLENIGKIDLQILRIAILEGFILKLTPEIVAIDEAIELAKEFSNDQSRKFVNGVLGNLIANKDNFTYLKS
ncbi:MAG TPA: transcription antitermination factor NusB [Candidatus Dojkabacteria bacterium]|nr:transcription antitermination factor NusB [Candidatus Dojkabacteria bacterium]